MIIILDLHIMIANYLKCSKIQHFVSYEGTCLGVFLNHQTTLYIHTFLNGNDID